MRVLITSAGRKVSLVQAFQETGAEVIALDTNDLSPALFIADEKHICPSRGEQLIEFIQNIEHDILVPSSDDDVVFFAEHQNEFNSLVVVPPYDTAMICRNKRWFTWELDEKGFSYAKVLHFPHNLDFIKQKLIARPIIGSGSKGIIVIDPNTSNELPFLVDNWSEFIVQEYIEAQEYTVDLFATKDEVISVIPRKRSVVINGESWTAQTDYNQLIIDESTRLAKSLELLYHNTIQCFLKDGKVLFTEVNPRFGGGFTLGIAAGANTPEFLIDLANHKSIDYDGTVMNKTMLRYTKDIFV